LLQLVLKKYGAPPKLVNVVRQLYTDLKLVLKLGKLNTETLQEVGARQGDNMAPVLFLFVMTAFADLMEMGNEFCSAGISRPEMVRDLTRPSQRASRSRDTLTWFTKSVWLGSGS
jgi:hypothetical protein